MGALHAGHRSLVRRASNHGQATVLVSVFVNPLQFGPQEDFERYPRCLEADATCAADAGAQALFAPSVAEMYPGGESELTRLVPADSLQGALCGRHRPGHFNGVATVVARLLGLIRPQGRQTRSREPSAGATGQGTSTGLPPWWPACWA